MAKDKTSFQRRAQRRLERLQRGATRKQIAKEFGPGSRTSKNVQDARAEKKAAEMLSGTFKVKLPSGRTEAPKRRPPGARRSTNTLEDRGKQRRKIARDLGFKTN